MDVYDAIKSKRAVRKFKEQPLLEGEIKRILNAGRLAQSSKNMQAWHFLAITDRTILGELSKLGDWAGHLAGAVFGVAILTPDPDLRFSVMFDAGQAAAYMQLVGWELDIGSCLATIYKRDEARQLLGFPEELHIRIAISFGYLIDPDEYRLDTGRRKPMKSGRRGFDQVVHRNHWNQALSVHNPLED